MRLHSRAGAVGAALVALGALAARADGGAVGGDGQIPRHASGPVLAASRGSPDPPRREHPPSLDARSSRKPERAMNDIPQSRNRRLAQPAAEARCRELERHFS
jgi:hypothetical protein